MSRFLFSCVATDDRAGNGGDNFKTVVHFRFSAECDFLFFDNGDFVLPPVPHIFIRCDPLQRTSVCRMIDGHIPLILFHISSTLPCTLCISLDPYRQSPCDKGLGLSERCFSGKTIPIMKSIPSLSLCLYQECLNIIETRFLINEITLSLLSQ
jgi:hypothetical protein